MPLFRICCSHQISIVDGRKDKWWLHQVMFPAMKCGHFSLRCWLRLIRDCSLHKINPAWLINKVHLIFLIDNLYSNCLLISKLIDIADSHRATCMIYRKHSWPSFYWRRWEWVLITKHAVSSPRGAVILRVMCSVTIMKIVSFFESAPRRFWLLFTADTFPYNVVASASHVYSQERRTTKFLHVVVK